MSQEKLRGWLKLPDGPWPPNHYALIGMKPGEGSPVEIESLVLERLELLRRYQLPHPDEATEGMNLLARALDTLTDPEERLKYDAKLGLKAPARVEEPAPLVHDTLNTLFPGLPPLPSLTGRRPFVFDEEPILPEAILLPEVEYEANIDDEPEFLDEPALPAAILLPVPPPIARLDDSKAREERRSLRPKSPKREVYADLARVRKVLRIWERARPLFGDVEQTFLRRTEMLALMSCLAELRPLLSTVPDLIATGRRPGAIVAALARQRLMFDTLRSLLPDQREALAKDFRGAHYRLAGYYDELRDEVSRMNQQTWMRSTGRPMLRYLANHPEWLILPLGILALIVSVVRSV